MVKLYTKFEVSIYTRYEDMKGSTQWSALRWLEVIQGHGKCHHRTHTTCFSTLIESILCVCRIPKAVVNEGGDWGTRAPSLSSEGPHFCISCQQCNRQFRSQVLILVILYENLHHDVSVKSVSFSSHQRRHTRLHCWICLFYTSAVLSD